MNYLLHLFIYFCVYALLAASLNLIIGYCGLINLAHVGYFAVGAYTYALVTLRLHWGYLPAVLCAFIIPALLSFLLSLQAWRLKGSFFVLGSLAVQVVLFNAIYNWHAPGADFGTMANLTNGPHGISGAPKPVIFGYEFDTIGGIAVISGLVLAGGLSIMALLVFSPWGRVLQAMRDDELAARGLGKNVRFLKVQAFFVACGIAGVAGALYASYVGYVDPSLASIDESILVVSMLIVGGAGNFRGPLTGAAVLLGMLEALRLLHVPESMAGEVRMVAYGLLIVLMMHFRPEGIAGSYRIE